MVQDLFKKYEIELESQELKTFQKFLKIFKDKNSQINLSAIREDEAIIEKHFIDSIMLNIFLKFNESSSGLVENIGVIKVADIGTGGGFPLIPLAIINPNIYFVGIDSVLKKLKAVDEFAKELKLRNIKTVSGRAEEIGQNVEYREIFDFVVSRATAFLPTLLEYAIPLLKVGGIFIAYKLKDEKELKSSKRALEKLGAKILKVKNYKLANQDRMLVFIKKFEKTNIKYPRKVGMPLSKPL